MDSPNLLVPLVITVLAILTPRVLFQTVGRASDGIAQLFVPPDRSLGWPHGVQESDEPWGWHEAPPTGDGPAPDDGFPLGEIVELPSATAPTRGGLFVAVHPVERDRAGDRAA